MWIYFKSDLSEHRLIKEFLSYLTNITENYFSINSNTVEDKQPTKSM